MAILPIALYPHPLLSQKAAEVEKVDDKIRQLLTDMADTMYEANGVGLAAPQVAVSLRCVVIDTGPVSESNPQALGLLKMVNPAITHASGEIVWEEGCLSLPEFLIEETRHAEVTCSYLNEKGEGKTLSAKGLLAVAIQHEIDHLDGKLIIDDISSIKKDLYITKIKKGKIVPKYKVI
ncbi:MAG: peptide deformylase [Deltaproteobacteria bacterium CG11_big_fil_rev_8_21_14_0_20_42_23]|nr:MAG: peptide deformylase [Deltaproteobacteria bacterium CG11_big_fil_rev_8_21_14_0_20_42_23]PJC64100.1 MAG: peptide deformylase [Deltaproteobacteria bacterium CG_4_9_14_0_2_um_filter_42_21]